MKKDNSLTVSIIMNCHNGETFLKQSIDSIINQSFKNWELIFFDNVSDDNSLEIVDSFNDKRIKVFKSEKFINLYHARNEAIQKAKVRGKSKKKLKALLGDIQMWPYTDEELEFINGK